MAAELAAYRTTSSNFRKHTHPNPIQRWLLQRFHRTATELMHLTAPQTILDAGCGEGFAMRHVLQRGVEVGIGLDGSAEALHVARALNPQSSFTSGDLTNLPFGSASFDMVVCMEVLEHLSNPDRGLAELCRVSRQWLLLSVPNEPLFRGANFLRGKNVAALGNDPGHVNHWSAHAFEAFVTRQCRVIAVQPSFPWTLALCRVD